MAKFTPVPLSNIAGDTASASTINSNFTAVQAAIEKTLSRDGTTPNQMTADLDMNSNDILNVGTLETDSITINDVNLSTIVDEVTEQADRAVAAADRAEAAALSAGADLEDRSDLVSAIAGGLVIQAGEIYWAGGLPYIGTLGATAIADLPDLLPSGTVYVDHFGGVGDAILNGTTGALTSGTDNLAAFNAMISYMASADVDGNLLPGIYYSSAQITNNSNQTLRGSSRLASTIHFKSTVNNECGILIPPGTSSCGVKDMTVSFEATVAKLANNGQFFACIGVGGTYFFSNAPDPITGFEIENVRCLRANTTSSGSAIAVTGYVTGGMIRNIDALGTKRVQNGIVAMHWSGLGGPYGSTVTETYHVGNITISGINGEGTNIPVSCSATYNIRILDIIRAKGCLQALTFLPGDETNRLAIPAQKELVGLGNYIEGIYIEDLGSSTDPAISMFGNGQSPFAFFDAPDNAVGLQQQLYTELTIGSIVGKNTTPQSRELIEVMKWVGDLKIGKIDVGDSFTAALVDIRDCDGVRIDDVRAAATFTSSGAITISGSCRNIYINGGKVKNTDVDTAVRRVLYIEGTSTNATLSADASAAATEIFVTGSVGADVVTNTPLTVNGHLVWTTAYVESANTRIPITPLPAAVTTGQAVVIDQSTQFDIKLDIEGGGRTCEFNTCRGRLAGSVVGSGEQALRFETGAKVLLDHIEVRGAGRGRIANPALATREILIGDMANVVVLGGRLGIDPEYTELNIDISAASTNDRRLIMFGTEFIGQGISGYIGGSGNDTDYELVNCYTTAGAPVGTNVGTAGTGVTARELGNRRIHQTVLTVNTTLPAIAGGASLAVGKLLYTLPAGSIIVENVRMSLAITQTQGNINADTPDGGIGTTLASGAVATLDLAGAGAENLVTGQTFNNCTGTTENIIIINQPLVINAADNHTIYYNVADGWAAGGDTGALLTGSVTIDWEYIGT